MPNFKILSIMAVKQIKELAKELGIPKEKCFVHIDAKVALWWISKPKEDLKVYVWNRVKVIQDADINVLYTESKNNPSYLLTKYKSSPKTKKIVDEATSMLVQSIKNVNLLIRINYFLF